jgi:hypothetical protein
MKSGLQARLQAAEAHLAAQRKAQRDPRLKLLSDQELGALYDLVRADPNPPVDELAAALKWPESKVVEFWSDHPAGQSEEPRALST